MDYAEKKERRIARFRELAEKHRGLSNTRYKRATSMANAIPFGQPILVGHHSEKRDRNYRAKIWNNFSKAYEHNKTAEYYERRAEAAALP